ncbi:MAG: 2-hydroxyacid dehydrogenase [Thermovirgaceae bacterium]|nr:2-hydroxyacid dehydrogenase [Thermovirgaceae bacterium]
MTTRRVIATFPPDVPGDEAVAKAIGNAAAISRIAERNDPERASMLKQADAVISFMMHNELDREDYALLKEGCLLQSLQAGVDALPFDDIPERVVICANTGAWADPMAEHILGMILSLGKYLQKCHKRLENGQFDRSIVSTWFRGKTCGFVGYGGIAKAVARLVSPMGMEIIAVNTSGKTDDQVDFIGDMRSLQKILKESDVLVIAVPLTKKTKGMIGKVELSMMKKDAIFINPARGAIIDQKALYEHMKANPDFRVGIDAWWVEPHTHGEFRLDHPFFELDNLLGSPHNTNLVDGIFPKAVRMGAMNVKAFLEGLPPRGVIDRTDYEF